MTPTDIAAPWTLAFPAAYVYAAWRAGVLAVVPEFVIPGVIWYPAFKAWEREVLEEEVGKVPEGIPAAAHA